MLIGRLFLAVTLLPCTLAFGVAPTTQQSIGRVELMPNLPAPFKLKDFKAVARGYDKLVFNFDKTGDYTPLIWWDDSKVNMPLRGFGMYSYVGKNQQPGTTDHEAITTLGALLGATVAGIDKSVGEHNFVEMAQQYFNSADGENVVTNNIGHKTGDTYWYETFPQILFNCIADRYPNTPRFDQIIRTSADRWYDAYTTLAKMSGGLNFDHTAFSLARMKPVDNGKWHEPDGAAGIAWIEYSAYRKFGDKKYLDAASALTSYLESRDTNPLYEIDLPFGAYVAARLNAEHDQNHDVGRLLNWCFDPSDTRSGWGVIVGKWGDYDCSGICGSVTDGGGYGFVMNTFAMGATLVPLVRYDERYARAIGKWMLNAMNTVRLCYPDELPRDMQSCPDWKSDPANVIPYEGIRKVGKGKSPYAQGDALIDGWGKTDFGMYGGGFVGIFGGIISQTDDAMIPQLDVLATDFFHDKALPSYLYYNPYAQTKSVTIKIGDQPTDLYDAIRNEFVARSSKGTANITLEPDSAAVIVLVPAGAKLTHDGRRTLADGVVIDFDNGRVPRPALKPPPVREDLSSTIGASRATIKVDGNADDWKNLKSQTVRLNTGGRGKMEAAVRFAWDSDFLYILVQQTAPAARVHEAPDLTKYSNATWDWDSAVMNFDIGNSKLPCIGDFVFHMAFNSSGASDLFFAPSGDPKESRVHTATSGSAEKGNRVIEARIAWSGLIGYAFNGNKDLNAKFGQIKPGLRFGCEPMIAEYNHTGQSYIGGGQYKKPTGFDVNSRDILLQD